MKNIFLTYSNVLLHDDIMLEIQLALLFQYYHSSSLLYIHCSNNIMLVRQPIIHFYYYICLKFNILIFNHKLPFPLFSFSIVTWKWELETHWPIFWNNGTMIFRNSTASVISNISSISVKNITSLALFTLGQYLNNPCTI